MSVTKLLSRIVAPSELLDELEASDAKKKKMALSLHDHTYGKSCHRLIVLYTESQLTLGCIVLLGITSDPLTQFSCVLSALIHDVDHAGVPNSQLCIENKTLADVYQGKSVAEQNSLDLSWDMLMDDQFADLRAAIYTTEVEHQRFRSLVVQSVMATDIMDKDLKAARNDRWKKAFTEDCLAQDVQTVVNRKATIVIEHLIQASDVAHTMQVRKACRYWTCTERVHG
jgi:3'5'-cyclic nucleotide phosphodiesterase